LDGGIISIIKVDLTVLYIGPQVRIDGTPGAMVIANYYRLPLSLLHLRIPLHTSVFGIDSLRPSIPAIDICKTAALTRESLLIDPVGRGNAK
jgi:hypothetical protein